MKGRQCVTCASGASRPAVQGCPRSGQRIESLSRMFIGRGGRYVLFVRLHIFAWSPSYYKSRPLLEDTGFAVRITRCGENTRHSEAVGEYWLLWQRVRRIPKGRALMCALFSPGRIAPFGEHPRVPPCTGDLGRGSGGWKSPLCPLASGQV